MGNHMHQRSLDAVLTLVEGHRDAATFDISVLIFVTYLTSYKSIQYISDKLKSASKRRCSTGRYYENTTNTVL